MIISVQQLLIFHNLLSEFPAAHRLPAQRVLSMLPAPPRLGAQQAEPGQRPGDRLQGHGGGLHEVARQGKRESLAKNLPRICTSKLSLQVLFALVQL